MPRTNEKEKGFILLEKDLSVISVVNNPKLSPYLDVFRHYPENVLLQNLGILTGFFRINDLGEESAYIVNFISSVLKKEYYANPKRPIEGSFDSALRKVNLALSEIAKEGNINWLGKIDGAVCTLEKNNLHFSVCGKAKVFLFRNQQLMEISADMAPQEIEPNPLKTFVDVSSGRLEKEDKIIVCGDDVFQIFSEEELRKSAIRFSREKFTQFLKTALTNKLDTVGTIVIDIFEKKEKKPTAYPKIEEKTYNVFSKKVFEEKKDSPKGLNEILKEENKKEYTDGKTGHIYIQEEEHAKKEGEPNIHWFLFKEKLADIYYWSKDKSKGKITSLGRAISRSTNNLAKSMKAKAEERKKIKMDKKEQLAKEKEEKEIAMAETLKNKEKELEKERLEKEKLNKPFPTQTPLDNASDIEKPAKPTYNEPFLARLAKRKEELERQEQGNKEEIQTKKDIFAPFKKLTPDFGKIKEAFASLSGKQKIYAASIILLIFIVPLVFLKIQAAIKTKPTLKQVEQKIPDAKELLSQEKNIIFLDRLEKLLEVQNLKNITILNEKIITVGDDKLTTKDTNGDVKEISWPQEYGVPEEIAPMKDLNLALIYTDQNKVISFLSATSQLKENSISIPADSKITGIGTYLTYAYLLDSKNNQIYRYPRAEGGFGDKTSWLKDDLNLSNACCMAIDENVYLISSGNIIKLFKGTNQNLTLEQTVNPFTPDKIFTDSNTQNLYVLDKENGRVIKFGKDGNIINQYFHEDIKNAIDLAAAEKDGKAYLINSEGLISFSLE